MKKFLLLISFFSLLSLLTGCASDQQVALLQEQNQLLQQQTQTTQTAIQSNTNFEKNLKCQERGDVLKQQYNNVYSAYYNETAGTCYVKFYDKNQMLTEGSIEDFGPTVSVSIVQLQQSVKLYGGVTYQEVINTLDSFQQPTYKGLIIKLLLAGNIKDMQIIIGMTGGNVDGYFGPVTLNYLKETATVKEQTQQNTTNSYDTNNITTTANTPPTPTTNYNTTNYDTSTQNSCCKICTKGKACGDSCINVNYTCHKGVGCACDG